MNVEIMAKRLRETREKLNLTRQELSNASGVSQSMIYYYEKGEKIPSVTAFYSLCKALNMSADYMLGFAEFPKELDLIIASEEYKKAFSEKNREIRETFAYNEIFQQLSEMIAEKKETIDRIRDRKKNQ